MATVGNIEIFLLPKYDSDSIPIFVRLAICLAQVFVFNRIYRFDIPKE